MIIYLARHGQTRLNKNHLMQGRTDEPLSDYGIAQAEYMRKKLLADHPGLTFDAVYSSTLQRAVRTASILGNVPEAQIIRDIRIVEADFGKYEKCPYHLMGPWMTLYWRLPEVFPAPPTVETTASMVERAHSFLRDLEKNDYENVLVACHGGILRSLFGYMEGKKRGYIWRPKPLNCEIRVYESRDGEKNFIKKYACDAKL